MVAHWIDLSQLWLSCETCNLEYEIMTNPWNPYQNKLEIPIILNQILKAKIDKKKYIKLKKG
jgi:frataxin-like iron-binding protein CyaY